MECVLETCDPDSYTNSDTYVDDQGVPKWVNSMSTKIDSLKKNKTGNLFLDHKE